MVLDVSDVEIGNKKIIKKKLNLIKFYRECVTELDYTRLEKELCKKNETQYDKLEVKQAVANNGENAFQINAIFVIFIISFVMMF